MAFDLSKLNFFNKLDARARVFVIFAGVVGVGLGIYLLSNFMSSDATTLGPSTVANAPQGLQSVPGAQLNPEFGRAVRQANEQAAQQAQMSGTSAVPTLINTGQQVSSDTQCTVMCGDDVDCVKTNLDTWVKTGKLSLDHAKAIEELAEKNVAVAEFGAMLNNRLQEANTKFTPEQARTLLECYTKRHLNLQAEASAKSLDTLIKAGKLPLEAANRLLEAQKKNVTPAEYAALLQEMVKEGKIDPETAQRLLNQYTQQRGTEAVARTITTLREMQRSGQITPDVAKTLEDLVARNVPVSELERQLQSYVDAGKLTPLAAKKILDAYRKQKADMSAVSSMNTLIEQAIEDAYAELRDLQRDKLITPETAATIKAMIDTKVSSATFEAGIAQLEQEGKLSPEIAKLKLADYKKIQDLQALSESLNRLADNNAPCSNQEEPLKVAVTAGALTPEQAAQLVKECQVSKITATGSKPIEGTSEFAQLQRRLQEASASGSGPSGSTSSAASPAVFSEAQARSEQEAFEARQARIEGMMQAMSGQAGQLIAAWAPPTMQHKAGTPDDKDNKAKTGEVSGDTSATTTTTTTSTGPTAAPVIKAGTIIFAVLDTAVNSDYPDSPVLATVVEGKFKGAKMMGKLITTKGVSGQMDRVTLNFTLMNMDDWPRSKTATAYGIDPDTARTVLASNVNYHYMQRFGALMATSFLQGYGQAVMSSGGQSTQSAFGTSTSNPELSPSGKLASAFGQMAQAVGEATKNYTERPPTVVVDSGVGLGILFMTDVT